MRAFQVDPIGLRLAIDVMEMPVRLGVVPPQVGKDRRMMGIGVGADEMSAASVQRRSCRGEAVVIFGHRLVEVGPEAEGRTIRVRKGGQPDPDAPCAGDGLAQPGDQPPADPRLGRSCHPLGQRPRTDRP